MMKRKWMAPMVALLLCVGMIGVGFATWVITSTDHQSTNGQFEVYGVESRAIRITPSMSDSTIKFGGNDANSATSGKWFSFTAGAVEDLSATLKIVINNWNELKGQTGNAITLTLTGGVVLNDSSFEPYINTPDEGTITISHNGTKWVVAGSVGADAGWGTPTFDEVNGEVFLQLNFKWGQEAFGGMNPLAYYNQTGKSYDTDGAAALEAMEKLEELNGIEGAYSITVDASVSAAAQS